MAVEGPRTQLSQQQRPRSLRLALAGISSLPILVADGLGQLPVQGTLEACHVDER